MEESRICLVARNKDSIIVSGVNYYSQELEAKLEQLQGIGQSFVAAFPTRPRGADTEQLVITFATTLHDEDHEDLYQLLVAIRNTTILLWGFRPALILPLPREAFPKTSLGKIQRSLMRKRFEAGDYADHINDVRRITSRQEAAYVAPDGSSERAIADVFAQILGMSPGTVSAGASFFDLGGTSLDIMKLTRALERILGPKVGLPLVLQNPSVRQLAQYCSSGAPALVREYDPIVPLQVTGKKIPLFCVHPGNGEIFILTNVAKYFLNDRPFYALRPRGFNDGEQRFHTLEDMVDSYVNAILKRQPRGPYAVAGYSLGCQIAFEVTRELERRGNQIGFLGCIDHGPSWEVTQLAFNMATGLALVIDLITLDQYERLNRELDPQLPSDEVCDHVLRLASSARLAELGLDKQRFATWARVAHSVETLLFGHVNSGLVDKMTIFCSEGISPRYVRTTWTRQTWRAELERWNDRVKHPKYVDVPGDHHALMGPKHVAVFQSRLRNEIDLALAGL
jgi:thioesterase domain-containing protein/acyl carrier protein